MLSRSKRGSLDHVVPGLDAALSDAEMQQMFQLETAVADAEKTLSRRRSSASGPLTAVTVNQRLLECAKACTKCAA